MTACDDIVADIFVSICAGIHFLNDAILVQNAVKGSRLKRSKCACAENSEHTNSFYKIFHHEKSTIGLKFLRINILLIL